MSQLLQGTTVIAAFLAGMVALFAPCCISVMLPAYLATGVHRRSALVAMTFVFAAGVATVIVPIAFGVTAVSRLINEYHPIIYTVMAAAMAVLGILMLLGRSMSLPMVGLRARPGGGSSRAYLLGVFSGVATACCAPVLAGAVILAGASSDFVTSLGISVAYVFGLVAPLFAVALVWDGRKLGQTSWLRARAVRLSLGGHSRYVPLTSLVGGLLLIAMSVMTAVIAVTGPGSATSGWQLRMTTTLQHVAHVLTTFAGHVPGWTTALVVLTALALLARLAVHQTSAVTAHGEPGEDDDGTESLEDLGASGSPVVATPGAEPCCAGSGGLPEQQVETGAMAPGAATVPQGGCR
jgi:cytochrome c biogenesis protein CcdA